MADIFSLCGLDILQFLFVSIADDAFAKRGSLCTRRITVDRCTAGCSRSYVGDDHSSYFFVIAIIPIFNNKEYCFNLLCGC